MINILKKKGGVKMFTEFESQIAETALIYFREFIKNQYDYFKHLTTLTTGSILIIIGIIKGIFDKPEGIVLIAISFFFFLISLISALYMLQVLNGFNEALFNSFVKILQVTEDTMNELQDELKSKTDSISKSAKVFHPVTDFSFLLGIVAFLVFTFINFI